MRLNPTQAAGTAVLVAMVHCSAMAASHVPAANTAAVAAEENTETTLPVDLRELPPTAAGRDGHADIPLHFVPPNVQALQELGQPGEPGSQSPAEKMLPFRF